MSNFIKEAFKELELLHESSFDLNDEEDIEELKHFSEKDSLDGIEMIVDVAATEEDELQDSYVGKVLLWCPICHTIHYADKDSIVAEEKEEVEDIDGVELQEEETLVNLEEVCPECHEKGQGFIVKGEVAAYDEDMAKVDEPEEKPEEDELGDLPELEVEEEEKVEEESLQSKNSKKLKESLKTKKQPKKEFKDNFSLLESLMEGDLSKEQVEEKEEEECIDDTCTLEEKGLTRKLGSKLSRKEEALKDKKLDDIDAKKDDKKELAKKKYQKAVDDADADRDDEVKELKESDKPAATSMEDCQKWVDYDMKHYGKISKRTNELVKKAGFQILKDDHGDYEVGVGKYSESLKEDTVKLPKTVTFDASEVALDSDDEDPSEILSDLLSDEYGYCHFGFDYDVEKNEFGEPSKFICKNIKWDTSESLKEDTVKQGNAWVNKGKEGTHGKFKTKKEADAQRKAMFARGYKESLEESLSWEDLYDVSTAWEDYKNKAGYEYNGDASTALEFIDEYVKEHKDLDNEEDRDALFIHISVIEEPGNVEESCKGKKCEKLKESQEDYYVLSDGKNPRKSRTFEKIEDIDKFVNGIEVKDGVYYELVHFVNGNPTKVWDSKNGKCEESLEEAAGKKPKMLHYTIKFGEEPDEDKIVDERKFQDKIIERQKISTKTKLSEVVNEYFNRVKDVTWFKNLNKPFALVEVFENDDNYKKGLADTWYVFDVRNGKIVSGLESDWNDVVNEGKITEESKLIEKPVYDLSPRFDSRNSFYGKARVEVRPDGSQVLWSYRTPVVYISSDGKEAKLLRYGYYGWSSSQTTLRHVKDFLKQNGFEAGSSKDLAKTYEVVDYDTLRESKDGCKRKMNIKKMTEVYSKISNNKTLKESASDVYSDIIERAKMLVDEGSTVEEAINRAIDDGLIWYADQWEIIEDEFLPQELFTKNGQPIINELFDIVWGEVSGDVQEYYDEKHSKDDEDWLDDIDESLFDKLVNKYCKKIYENVAQYETTSGTLHEGKLTLDGILTYKSGKKIPTKFVFENMTKTKTGLIKLTGLNETFSQSKRAFTLTTKLQEKKLLAESLSYNYKVTVDNVDRTLQGRVVNRK